jgi:hypothetical protein
MNVEFNTIWGRLFGCLSKTNKGVAVVIMEKEGCKADQFC